VTGRYKHILFDLDGTLTDSAEGVTRSVHYALSKFGIQTSPEKLKLFVGPPLQKSFEEVYGFNEKQSRRAINYYREYYRGKGIYENKLYPNIPEMLQALKDSGKKLYLATSKPTFFATRVLHHFAIDSYFISIAGSNLDGTREEKSAVISYLFVNNGELEKTNTVMVGDRKHDIVGAKSCGLDSIAVTYGYGSAEELQEAAPDYLVHSVRELKELLLAK